jgi:hypothetical protein
MSNQEKMVELIEKIDDLVKPTRIGSSISRQVDDLIEEWKSSFRPPVKKELDEVVITVPVKKCDKCPFHKTERTAGAGYALDYFCGKIDNKEITGYVEWESEMPGVPEWCPFRKKGENTDDE